MNSQFDFIIIGSGPAGFAAACYSAKLGHKVVMIDNRDRIGGTCLNVGCIPSKCFLHDTELYSEARKEFRQHGVLCDNINFDFTAMINRKNRVISDLAKGMHKSCDDYGITFLQGTASFESANTVSVKHDDSVLLIEAKIGIVIATGGTSSALPQCPFDGVDILSSSDILALPSLPASLVCVGSGAIGLELGSIMSRLGVKTTVIEYLPSILPAMDSEVSTALMRILQRQGIRFYTNSNVASIVHDENQLLLTVEDNESKSSTEFTTEKVLVSVGRKPSTEALGLNKIGITLSKRGQIIVDDRFRTSVPGVWAIGDVIQGPMLAHKAEYDAKCWARTLVDNSISFNVSESYVQIPSVVYTSPEAASVGLSEKQAQVTYGDNIRIGKSTYITNGRAKAMGIRDGFVKVISDADKTLLGIHILGTNADSLISSAEMVMRYHGTVLDLEAMVYPHPTLSEVVKDACINLLSQ